MIRKKPFKNGLSIFTCSNCINDSLLEGLSRSWTWHDETESLKEFQISAATLKSIQAWTEEMDHKGKTGYIDIFYEIEVAKEYKERFFPNVDEVELLGLYLPNTEANLLVDDFVPQDKGFGRVGIEIGLSKRIAETESGIELGYDLIGVEPGGSFHSFQCHDLGAELAKRFKIKINDFGLLSSEHNWQEQVAFMNDEVNGCEPVPWYFAKIKQFKI